MLERLAALEEKGKKKTLKPPVEPKPALPCDECQVVCRTEKLLAQHKLAHKRVFMICDQCGMSCRTKERLANHKLSSHPVKVESAIPSDTGVSGKTVKQGRFLEKRSDSPTKKKSFSSRSSSLPNDKTQYRSREGSLSDMINSQKNIETCLKELLQVMRGQNSGTLQK